MSNQFLAPVYRNLYEDEFTSTTFESRLKMQKAIYLLQELGVPVGDYGFSWYKHGPYSQSLLDDTLRTGPQNHMELELSNYAAEQFEKLRTIIHSGDKGEYTMKKWVECLASIRYLQANVLPSGSTEDDIMKELMIRKTHLDDININKAAFEKISKLFS